jgi:hypothetical protein
MDDSSISGIGLLLILLTIYWSFRGLVQIFERHNSILVILYIVFLFPIAYIHMFLLGVFGSSYKKRMLREVKEKVEFDRLVEQEKTNEKLLIL